MIKFITRLRVQSESVRRKVAKRWLSIVLDSTTTNMIILEPCARKYTPIANHDSVTSDILP